MNYFLTLMDDLSSPTAVISTLPKCRIAASILKTSIWKSLFRPKKTIIDYFKYSETVELIKIAQCWITCFVV